jgi:hypothetical protein
MVWDSKAKRSGLMKWSKCRKEINLKQDDYIACLVAGKILKVGHPTCWGIWDIEDKVANIMVQYIW